jgi:membrane-bound lytic murein transglycosylase D
MVKRKNTFVLCAHHTVDRINNNIISMQYKVAETLLLHMKILTVLLCRCCVVFLLVSLSACSPHTKKSTLHQPGADATVTASQGEDDSTAVEPEETAQEELEALNRSGTWEFGATSGQGSSPLPTDIDLSGYDFPITVNKQVLYYLDLFQGKQKNNFSRWLARSTL